MSSSLTCRFLTHVDFSIPVIISALKVLSYVALLYLIEFLDAFLFLATATDEGQWRNFGRPLGRANFNMIEN